MGNDIKYVLLMALLMILLLALLVWKFNNTADKCDQSVGYQCDVSQVFNYNKKVYFKTF